MYFKRYYLGCLAHASYMIADEESKVAVVVDPQRDIDQYVQDATRHGFKIRYVFLTHFHADFVAGHIELRDQLGASILLGSKAEADFDFTPLSDGNSFDFGTVRLSILETPGHTPESISIVVFDLEKDRTQPYAVLTGDALFVGDVGRPDLMASIGLTADELAEQLYDSIRNKLLKLPDETLIFPAHGAGSMCGKQLGKEPSSTIGEQRKYNYALQPMTREEFKRLVTADQPEAPDYFAYDAALNRQDRETLRSAIDASLKPLSVDEVERMQRDGAQLLDTRDSAHFAGGHWQQSLNISLAGRFATWCGTLLDKNVPIVVIADPGHEEESIMRLGRIGFDEVLGFLMGGIESLSERPDLVTVTERITAMSLAEWLERDDAPILVDVRTEKESSEQSIEGSLNIPLPHLSDQLEQIPQNRPIVVHCKSGYRSSLAASLLQQRGVKRVFDLVGGIEAWESMQLPTLSSTAA